VLSGGFQDQLGFLPDARLDQQVTFEAATGFLRSRTEKEDHNQSVRKAHFRAVYCTIADRLCQSQERGEVFVSDEGI
jgi:hypothetical protein